MAQCSKSQLLEPAALHSSATRSPGNPRHRRRTGAAYRFAAPPTRPRNQYLRLAEGKPSGAIDGVTISSALSSMSLRSSRLWRASCTILEPSRTNARMASSRVTFSSSQARASAASMSSSKVIGRSSDDSPAAELNSASRVCEDHPDLQTR